MTLQTKTTLKDLPAIVVDTREQKPYTFAETKLGGNTVGIQTIRKTLTTGDYSLEGLEDRITVERKEVNDFYQSITNNRQRFENEVSRLSCFERAAIVVEGEFTTVTVPAFYGKRISGEAVTGTVASWFIRYGVPFWFLRYREDAQRFTLKLLIKFWEQRGNVSHTAGTEPTQVDKQDKADIVAELQRKIDAIQAKTKGLM